MNTFKIHSSITGAVPALGQIAVSTSWKQTANQTRKERAVCIPMEALRAPEVPESFRPLVESCLLAAAEQTLKDFVNAEPNNWEIPASVFARPQLVESYLSKADSWMSKEQFEIAFTGSATWKRITGRPEFANNVTYQMAANRFKDALLKITGKVAYIPRDQRDQILNKLDENDLSCEFGVFIVRRFEQMSRKDEAQEVSFADL